MSAASHCLGCGAKLPPSAKPAPPRKWCSERCRKAQYAQSCVDCGAITSHGSERPKQAEPRCAKCARRAMHAPQRALIEAMWAAGATSGQIEAAVGWNGSRGHLVGLYRYRGCDLPHRRTPEAVARMTAGWRRHREGR